jgi:penicillin-binding protein 2
VTDGRSTVRIRVLVTLVAFMFASLFTRLWFLQVLAAEKYRAEVGDNVVRTVEIPAKRGMILDDAGTVLVDNRISLVVTVNRELVGDRQEQVIYNLAKVLRITPREMSNRLREAGARYYSYQPVPVAADVSWKVVAWIKQHPDDFPGVDYLELPVRTHPHGVLAAHVLGYLGQVTEDQLKDPSFSGYEPGDIVGKTGVESQYEHWLVGTKGIVKYRVDRFGDNKGEIGYQPPRPGDNLVLTLDAETQRAAETSLREGIDFAHTVVDSATAKYLAATGGAVVVMDPTTGAIKALASYPTYDPELFVSGSSDERTRLIDAPRNPLLDRAIQGLYPPGSTYKPFIALSALKRGLATTTNYYPCPGTWEVPEDPLEEHFDNWTASDLGSLTMGGALVQSCDTIFYPLGFEYWRAWYNSRNDARPALPLQRDLRAAGFGRPTNVDIPFEKAGIVPDPVWKATVHREAPDIYPQGETYPADFINMSIGQGETLVTPLQIASAYSMLANDGVVCWPHVSDRIESPTGRTVREIRPRCTRRAAFSETAVRYVRDALAGVVHSPGTAASAFTGFPFSEVSVSGKTGTAQVFGQQDYSWFAAMTQGKGRRYVVVAMVEQGGHGSETAAPIVRHVIEQIYGLTPSEFTSGGVTD